MKKQRSDRKCIICIQESTNNYVFHELSGNIKEKDNFISQQGILRVVPTSSILYNSLFVLENPETRVSFFKICRKQWFTENVYTLWSSGREHNPEPSLSSSSSSVLPFANLHWTKVATLKRSIHLNTYKTSSLLQPQYYLQVDPNYDNSLTLSFTENFHLLTAKTTAEDPPFFTYHSLVGPVGKGGGLLTLISTSNWIFATAVCTLLIGIQEEIYCGHLVATRPTNIEEMQKLVQKYWEGGERGRENGEVEEVGKVEEEEKVEEEKKAEEEEMVEEKRKEGFNLVVNVSVGREGKEWKAAVEGVVVLRGEAPKEKEKE